MAAGPLARQVIGVEQVALDHGNDGSHDAGRQALSFIDTAAFSATGAAQVRYGVSGADLLVQVDLDGDGNADMAMLLQGAGGQTLTGGDFLL